MKYVVRLLVVLVVTCLVFVLAGVIATWAPDRSVQQLTARWAQTPSQFVAIQGMQVHVRDEGPRSDPVPIVLLHGTSASLHTWDGWTEALKGQRRVIRFDLPAFGLTGPSPQNDYTLEAYVRFVEDVVNALGVQTFTVAGNSLGGQVAWASAAALPHRVQSLVLVDAAGYPMQPQSVPIGFKIARIPGLRGLAEVVLPRGVIEASLRNVYGDPSKVTPELVDRYYELTLREGNRQALAYRFDQMQKMDVAKSMAAIKSLKVPTLILWGAKDRLIPLENGRRFAADITGSELVVFDDLGHVPQEEDAKRTVNAVLRFLQRP
jgi:pimeloyl-ACP methyl ester carboxylesterase